MSSAEQQSCIFQKLNEQSDLLKPLTEPPQFGKIYAAPYTEASQTHYYRARVESIHSSKSRDSIIQVSYAPYHRSLKVGKTILTIVTQLHTLVIKYFSIMMFFLMHSVTIFCSLTQVYSFMRLEYVVI